MGKWIIKQNIRVAAYIALVAVFMPVSAFDFSPISNSKVHGGFAAFRNACLFLKQQSEGQDRSQIGVLTKWDYGHWVIHYCGMPTVTSPLSNPYERSSKILYMSDMEEARAVLASKRVKYVISVLPSEDFQPLSSGLGIETEYMYFDGGSWFYKKEIFDTLNGRLSFLRYDLLPDWLKITYVSGASVDISGTKLPLIVVAQID